MAHQHGFNDNEDMPRRTVARRASGLAGLFLVAAGLVAVGIFLRNEGLARADQWANILGLLLNLIGVALAFVSALLAWRTWKDSRNITSGVKGAQYYIGPGINVSQVLPSTEAQAEVSTSNLPLRNPLFVDRDKLLQDLQETFDVAEHAAHNQRPVHHWQVLYGISGAGKSQLAVEYAHDVTGKYLGVWWIPAAQPMSILASLGALLRRLGLQEPLNSDDIVLALASQLTGGKRLLLIFDNAENVRAIMPYIPPTENCDVLVTSQNPSWGPVARTWPVGPLPHSDAANYLMRRRENADTSEIAFTLAGRLGCLPLALEQAASYMEQSSISLSEYLSRLETSRRDLMNVGLPADYGKTIYTAFRLTIGKVRLESRDAIRLLQLCSFMAAERIPHDLLQRAAHAYSMRLRRAVADIYGYDRAVTVLLKYSLVRRDVEGLTVHQTLQEFVLNETHTRERRRYREAVIEGLLAAWPDRPWSPDSWDRCRELVAHALRILEISSGERKTENVRSDAQLMMAVGLYFYGRRNLHGAQSFLEGSLKLSEQSYGQSDPEVAISLENLAVVLREIGNLESAESYLRRALQIRERRYGAFNIQIATTLDNLGITLREKGEFALAYNSLMRALNIREATAGTTSFEIVPSLENLAITLRSMGRFEEAKACLERALKIIETHDEPTQLTRARVVDSLGNVHAKLGQPALARAYHEEALSIMERQFGEAHPEIAITLGNLANALTALGDGVGAQTTLARALRIKQMAYGKSHPEIAITLGFMADERMVAQDWKTALSHLDQALEILRATYGSEHIEVASCKWKMSIAHKALGNHDLAKSIRVGVVEIARCTYGELLAEEVEVNEENLDAILMRVRDTVRARAWADQPQLRQAEPRIM
jgi:tetratricopeptide (TPR) repeat protein